MADGCCGGGCKGAKVTIKDRNGNPVAQFSGNPEVSVGIQAQDEGAPIPFSCGVGACRTCVGKVTKGMEYLNKEAVGPQHIPTEDDEVLTCVCAVREDVPDGAEIEIEAQNL